MAVCISVATERELECSPPSLFFVAKLRLCGVAAMCILHACPVVVRSDPAVHHSLLSHRLDLSAAAPTYVADFFRNLLTPSITYCRVAVTCSTQHRSCFTDLTHIGLTYIVFI